MNPLVPTGGEVVVLILGAVTVILWVIALLSLTKDQHYTPSQRLLWLLVILVAPLVGSGLWLSVSRKESKADKII